MAPRVRSALLLDRDIGTEALEYLEELGLGGLDCTDRVPAARLEMGDHGPTLWVADADRFVARFGARGRRRPLMAVATAPRETLTALNGVSFVHKLRSIRLVYPAGAGVCPELAVGPLGSVLVELVPEGVGTRRKATALGLIREGEAPATASWLVLDPLPLELDVRHALALHGASQVAPELVFVPPVPLAWPAGSYFDERLVRLRRALSAAIGPKAGAPVLLWLQSLVDDPLVQHLLMEGGRVTIDAAPGDPTRAALELWTPADAAGTPPLLSSWLVSPQTVAGPAWAAALALCLRQTLEATGLTIRHGAVRACWCVPNLRDVAPGGPRDGAWQLLNRLDAGLDRAASREFHARVLELSTGSDDIPDHDLAMLAFLAHTARCPWSADGGAPGDVAPWRRAWLDLLSGHLDGSDARDRLLRNAAKGGWSRVVEPAGPGAPAELVFPPSADDATLVYARLLLPRNAVVRRDAAPRLDSAARLDGAAALSGEVEDALALRQPIVANRKITRNFAMSVLNRAGDRTALIDGADWGVDRLDPRASVVARVDDSGVTFVASRLDVVARDGRALSLGDDDQIAVTVPRDGQTELEVRLAVALDVPGASPDEARFAALVAWEPGRTAEPARDVDLGTWRWQADRPAELELVAYPPKVRRLGWMPLGSPAMRRWIEPWRVALQELGDSPEPVACAAFVMRTEWPVWTVRELALRVEAVRYLRADPDDVLASAVDRFGVESALPDDTPVAQLPQLLGDRLKSRRRGPAAARKLAEPAEVRLSWAGEFLEINFQTVLPAGLIELRVPASTTPADPLYCQVGDGLVAVPIPRCRRGVFDVYTLLPGRDLPVTVSPVTRPEPGRSDVQLWLNTL